MQLTNEEYNLIVKLTNKAKLEWFDLCTDDYGNDYVIDIEEDEKLSLVDGLLLLDDCLTELKDYMLTDTEIQLYNKLIHRVRMYDKLDRNRLTTLLYNTITLLEASTIGGTLIGTELQDEIDITTDEYDYIMDGDWYGRLSKDNIR